MSRSITLAAVATLAAGLAPVSISTAQAQGYYDSSESIVVTAPHKRTEGRSATGAPIEVMEAQSTVYFGDLNLSTRAGQRELRDRVADAADSSCRWIDETFRPDPATSTSNSQCKAEAIRRAERQVNDAIAMGG